MGFFGGVFYCQPWTQEELAKVRDEMAAEGKAAEVVAAKYDKVKRVLKIYVDRYNYCKEKHTGTRYLTLL